MGRKKRASHKKNKKVEKGARGCTGKKKKKRGGGEKKAILYRGITQKKKKGGGCAGAGILYKTEKERESAFSSRRGLGKKGLF